MTRHWTRGELAAVIEDAQSTNPGQIADAILAVGVLGDVWAAGMATGTSRAMRYMSDEPDLPLAGPEDNPYRDGAS